MIGENAFYIELYRKSQTQTLGVNRPLQINFDRRIPNYWGGGGVSLGWLKITLEKIPLY